jgi:hypothetical protein
MHDCNQGYHAFYFVELDVTNKIKLLCHAIGGNPQEGEGEKGEKGEKG